MNVQKIYVNHVPASYDANQIKELFAACGTITEVIYPRDKKTKLPKGYAFVTFVETSATQSALAIHNTEIDGQTLIVEIAKEKSEKNYEKSKRQDKKKDKAKVQTGLKGKGKKGADKKGKTKRNKKDKAKEKINNDE